MAFSRRRFTLRKSGWAALGLMLAMLAALMVETIRVDVQYEALKKADQEYLACQSSVRDMAHASDKLTKEVRMFAETLDPAHMQAYFEEVNVDCRRDRAMETIQGIGGLMEEELNKAFTYSRLLEEREIYAMRLLCDGAGMAQADRPVEIQRCALNAADEQLSAAEKRTRGVQMLFDKAYEDMKDAIDSRTESIWNRNLACIQEQRAANEALLTRLFTLQMAMIPALIVLAALTLSMFEIRVCRPLRTAIRLEEQEKRLPEQGYEEFKRLFGLYNARLADREREKSTLRRAVEHDALTGLVNHTAFGKLVMYLQKSNAPLALLLLRVDRLRLLNEEQGREAGNEVLCRVAEMVPQCFRPYDTVFHLEEDIFAVLMVEVTATEGENIRKRVRKLNQSLAEQLKVPCGTISAGLAFSPRGYREEMRRQALKALDQAKDTGDCVLAEE